MRRTLLDRATERLTTLTAQFRQTFDLQMAQAQARAQATASRPELAAYLAAPTPHKAEAALAAMAYQGPQPELNRAVQLRDASGGIVLAQGGRPGASAFALGESDATPLVQVMPALLTGDSGVVGKLRQEGDSLLFPQAARVPGSPGGYFVNWRRVGAAAQARQQIEHILGSEAAFFFGNADGSLWSDLGRATAAPPVDPAHLNGVLRYQRPGRGEVLASAAAIPRTSWVFTVEFPTRAIFAPARAFLRLLLGIAVVCIGLGVLGAWLLSRRLVDPLLRLADGADALAAGDTSHRVQLARADELGRLGRSFNAMAAQVQESRHRLEHTVAERTRELGEAQDALVRREKLAVIGHLASGVGHEIRNPLGVMNNAIYYLEAVQPDAPAEVKEYLGILRHQVAISAKIVNDMLDFSRTTPAHRQPVRLDALADEQLERISLNGIRVRREYAANLPPALVDPVHAGQVIMNLVTNAAQAMDGSDGELIIRHRAGPPGTVQLEVCDTGPGIAPEVLGKIFEPLFTTKARGIGLGLAVSKSLALANGGELTVDSRLGQGATFRLTVPVADRA